MLFDNFVEFRVQKTNSLWSDVLERIDSSFKILSNEMKNHLTRLTKLDQLIFVNATWNKMQYASDETNFQKADYWQTPQEFITNKCGDCEDFALIKYFTLRELSYNPNDMRILLMKNNYESHAVLAVNLDNWYILDNQHKGIVKSSEYKKYTPVCSFNEHSFYTYVRKLSC